MSSTTTTKTTSTTTFKTTQATVGITTTPIAGLIAFNSQTLMNLMLTNYVGDLTGCLLNCSSNGYCYQNPLTGLVGCYCMQSFSGIACNIDSRPCSSSPCLNGATCTDVMSNNSYSCTCDPYFTDSNCATKLDVCSSETCSSHGSCADVNNTATCHCYESYFGDKCENEQEALKTEKIVIQTTSIIAIICILMFYLMFIACDIHSWYVGLYRRRRRRSAEPRNVGIVKYKYVYS